MMLTSQVGLAAILLAIGFSFVQPVKDKNPKSTLPSTSQDSTVADNNDAKSAAASTDTTATAATGKKKQDKVPPTIITTSDKQKKRKKATDSSPPPNNGGPVKTNDATSGGGLVLDTVVGLAKNRITYAKDKKAAEDAASKGNKPALPKNRWLRLKNYVMDMCPTAGGQPIYNPISYATLDCKSDEDCRKANDVGGKDDSAVCDTARFRKTGTGTDEASGGVCCSVKETCLGNWDYASATQDWPTFCPECGGKNQSPIDIPVSTTGAPALTLLADGAKIGFFNYDVTLNMQMINNGHTAQMNYDASVSEEGRPYIKLSPDKSKLPRDGEYELIQIHMHWSEDNSLGSEHTISKASYPMEIHLVHKRKQKSDEDKLALAVLAVFAQVNCDVDRKSPPDDVFDITDDVARIANDAHDKDAKPQPPLKLRLNSLLPQDKDSFFYYTGSLTTPPCSEIVEWTILKDPIQIPDYMLAELRKLPGHGQDTTLKTNNRPPQDLGSRKVFYRGDKAKLVGAIPTTKLCPGANDAPSGKSDDATTKTGSDKTAANVATGTNKPIKSTKSKPTSK